MNRLTTLHTGQSRCREDARLCILMNSTPSVTTALTHRARTRIGFVLCACLLSGHLAGMAAENGQPRVADPGWCGFNGLGGTGIYDDSKPPTTFDVKTGKNVRWVVPLPGWGHGMPLALKDRVLVGCEPGPKNDFPILVCLNAADGKELWRRELDHLDVLVPDPKEREALRQDWHAKLQYIYVGYNHNYEMKKATNDQEKATIAAKYLALGYKDRGTGRMPPPVDQATFDAREKRLRERGLRSDNFLHSGCGTDCVGNMFAAPVSDGRRIYASTSFGGFFCFDLNGTLVWKQAVPTLKPGTMWNGDVSFELNARTPIIYHSGAKDGSAMLLSDISDLVRAFDLETGAIKWVDQRPIPYKRMPKDTITRSSVGQIVSPVVLRVAGRDLLWSGCRAYLLPEGTPVPVEGWEKPGQQVLVKHDEPDVLFFTGNGDHAEWFDPGVRGEKWPYGSPAAVRFRLESAAISDASKAEGVSLVLKGTVLWDGFNVAKTMTPVPSAKTTQENGFSPCMVYADGRLYGRGGLIVDALTGKVVGGKTATIRGLQNAPGGTPRTGTILGIAQGHVYGLLEYEGPGHDNDAGMEVCTLDGRFVASNLLPKPDYSDVLLVIMRSIGCGDVDRHVTSFVNRVHWSYGNMFTFGPDCIYLRSMAHLWCVGAK